jgi:hypothetical protein
MGCATHREPAQLRLLSLQTASRRNSRFLPQGSAENAFYFRARMVNTARSMEQFHCRVSWEEFRWSQHVSSPYSLNFWPFSPKVGCIANRPHHCGARYCAAGQPAFTYHSKRLSHLGDSRFLLSTANNVRLGAVNDRIIN